MIQKNRLTPNIRTFGSLAYRVHNLHNLKEFLGNMKSFGFDLNMRIASTLYSIGFKRGHSVYLNHLATHLIESQIELSDFFLKKIDSDLKSLQSSIIDMVSIVKLLDDLFLKYMILRRERVKQVRKKSMKE